MALEIATHRGAAYTSGALALLIATASILTALGFEYIGGYVPCMLCLMERWAYYAAIPLLFVALVLTSGAHRRWAAALFLIVAVAFLANAGLATYHAGAEWKFWPGPATCGGGGGTLSTSAGTLLKDLQNTHPVPCDEASLRFLGLSFAGWNVVASLLLSALAYRAFRAAVKSAP